MIQYIAKSLKRAGRDNKGFTLVELMAVLAVLAIIAAIAVPRFTGTIEATRLKADKASALIIARAAEQYCMDNDLEDHDGTASDLGTDYFKEVPEPQADGEDEFYYVVEDGICTGVFYEDEEEGDNLLTDNIES